MKDRSHFFTEMRTTIPSSSRGTFFDHPTDTWQPAVDVYESEEGLSVLAELPGVDKDRIQVEVDKQRLRIRGIRPGLMPESARQVHHMEIQYGPFVRTLGLPDWADSTRIEAEYEGGYLRVTIPRKVG